MSADSDDLVKFISALALLVGGFCVVGWQIYEYLRYNIWPPVSVITALEWMKIQWALNPTDWVGLYNILTKVPLSVAMIVSGWMVVMSEQE